MTNAPDQCVLSVPSEAVAFPARYWWLKRIVVGFLSLAGGLCVVHWQWLAYAERIHARNVVDLNRLKAELGLLDESDLTPETREAISILDDAVRRIHLPRDLMDDVGGAYAFIQNYRTSSPRASACRREAFEELMEKNQWFLELVRQLRTGQTPSEQFLDRIPIKQLDTRDEVRAAMILLLQPAIQIPFVHGAREETLERILDVAYLRRLAAKYSSAPWEEPTLSCAYEEFEQLLECSAGQYGTRFSPPNDQRLKYQEGKPIQYSQMREWITSLADAEIPLEALRYGRFRGVESWMDRPYPNHNPTMFVLAVYDVYFEGRRIQVNPSFWMDVIQSVFEPALQLDHRRWYSREIGRIRELERFKAADDELDFNSVDKPVVGVIRRLAFCSTRHKRDTDKVMFAQSMAQRGLGAMTLADTFYMWEHGDYADSLDDLVPKYLPFVPIDPYDRHGAPLKYLASKHRPYSVGKNRRDDEGLSESFRRNDPDRKDDVDYYVERYPPLLVPKTEAQMQKTQSRGFFGALRRILSSKNADPEKGKVGGDKGEQAEENDKND